MWWLLLVLLNHSESSGTWTTTCNTPLSSDKVVSVSAVMGKASCSDIGSVSANDPTIVSEFCFSDGSLSNNSFSVNISAPWLVQRLQFVPVSFSTKGENYFPDSLRLATGSAWYRQDMNAVWSLVPVRGDMADISAGGMEADYLRVFVSAPNEIRFGLRILGCPLSETGKIEYVFSSASLSAIALNYGTVENFTSKLLALIQTWTNVDAGRLHIHIVPSSGEQAGITVEILVLPDSSPNAESVHDVIVSLSSNKELAEKLDSLKASIVDVDSQLCLGKNCPKGTVCINGQCASPFSGFLGAAAQVVPLDNSGNMRRILATAPLVQGSDVTPAIGNRELIAILIGAGTLIALVSIGLVRIYKHMKRNKANSE